MLGLIGGTALEQLALDESRTIAVDTPWGQPSAPLTLGRLADTGIVWLNRHGEHHTVPPHRINYRANIAAMAQQQVTGIIGLNAVGGITPTMTTGSLVLPDQIVDYSWGRDHSFSNGDDGPVLHVDFTDPYDQGLRGRLLAASAAAAIELIDGAVHAVVQGPRLETAAEIRRLQGDGCDIVGMTGMPEAALARELGIPYVSLAVVVNPAAGKGSGEITMTDIGRVMAATTPRLLRLLKACCRQ